MHRIALASLFVGVVVSATLSALPAEAAPAVEGQPWNGSSILRDPEWQKSFLGSYGFLSGAEPEISASELEFMREVIDLMQANPKAAAAMLEQRSGPESSAAVDFILGNLSFQNGDTVKAIEAYDRALGKFPDFRRAHKNMGLLKVQLGDWDGGIRHLTRAIELGDRDGRSYGLLGYCHVNKENFFAAEEAYRTAILQQPETKDWQLGLARSLLGQEKYADVAALFSGYLQKHPGDAEAWKLQANAYLGLEQPMAAAVNLEAVRMLGKADATLLNLLGDIYLNEGISDLASEAYLQVIETDRSGDQYKAAYRAADLLYRAQAIDESARLVETIRKRYAKGLTTDRELELLTLQAKLARARGRTGEAAKLLEDIVARDGTRGDALLELARYQRDQGNDQRALLLLERAQKLEAFEYQALVETAQFRVSKREYAEGVKLLKQALRIKSEPRIEQYLAKVEAAASRQ
ncbi:MAG: tetratricopeptide repeat protein [Myxococcota bacterium]